MIQSGSNILVRLYVGADIRTAMNKKIVVKRPDNSVVEWTATGGSNFLEHRTSAPEIDLPGQYQLQAQVLLDGNLLKSDIVEMTVERALA